jgi:hypothetical protein
LGAIVVDSGNYFIVKNHIGGAEDFFCEGHRRIYLCLVDLIASSRVVDPLTLADELKKQGDLELIGGHQYIAGLLDGLPDPPHVEEYVRIIQEISKRRAIASFGQSLSNLATGDTSVSDLQDDIHRFASHLSSDVLLGSVEIQCWDDLPDVFSLEVPPVEFVIPDFVQRNGISLFAGAFGVGKSFLFAHKLAVAVVSGGDFLGRRCERRPCLIVDRGENPFPVIVERLKRLSKPGILPPKVWAQGMNGFNGPPSLGDDRLLRMAKEHKPMMIFDSLIGFHDGDENSATDMRKTMACLRRLADVGASVVVLHHCGKSEEVDFRGSTAIVDAVDIAYRLKKHTNHLALRCFKNRSGALRNFDVHADFDEGIFEIVSVDRNCRQPSGVEALRQIISAQPGITRTKIVNFSRMRQEDARRLLDENEDREWTSSLRNGAKRYFLKDSSESPKSVPDVTVDAEGRTASEPTSERPDVPGRTGERPHIPTPKGGMRTPTIQEAINAKNLCNTGQQI